MKYTYTVEQLDAPNSYMFVKYMAEGRVDIYKNINPSQFDKEHLKELVRAAAPSVIEIWERQEAQAAVDLESLGFDEVESDEYVAPPPPVEVEIIDQTEQALTNLEITRKEVEYGGVQWGDYYFDTSPESQAKISAAVTGARFRKRDIKWKCARVTEEGEMTLAYARLSASDIDEVAALVQDHVQKCFDTEALCYEALLAGEPIDFRDTFNA